MYVASTNLLKTALLAVYILTMCSCLKDKCTTSIPSKVYTPVYASLDSLRKPIVSESPRDITDAGKIYIYGNYIFLNELNKGIHIIDNTNPAAPKKIAFINIPGNVDMAVNGNVMYVDTYIDMVALDISDPYHVREAKRLKNVFYLRSYEYGIMVDTTKGVITSFNVKDTVLTSVCNNDRWNGDYMYIPVTNSAVVSNKSNMVAPSANGKGGSTAKFGLKDHMLYTINLGIIQVFNVQQAMDPEKKNDVYAGAVIETVFPYDHYLFIGGQAGMYIYDITNPEVPVAAGAMTHMTACDPVVVEGQTAYVTLRTAVCRVGDINQLDVINVADVQHPSLIKSYAMTSPYGLGIDGDNLFICEGTNGLRFLHAADPMQIETKKILTDIEAYDVIPNNHVLLVTAKDGLYQYDYANLSEPKLLSKVGIVHK